MRHIPLKRIMTSMTILGFLLISLLILTNQASAAQFTGDNFEDNISVKFSPNRPSEYQSVNVTIGSKYGVPIIQADLWVEINGPQYTSSGAYQMERINTTHRYTVLNGYAAQTNVTFHITAYDGLNQIKSKNYYYDVAAKRSWKYPSFAQNVNLQFGPNPPDYNQGVNLTITSKDLDVKIQRADVNVSIKLPDFQEELKGAELMDKVDDYTFQAAIPPYPGSAEITFFITAYDELWNPTTSDSFTYTVTPPQEKFLYGIYVVVFNNITSQYMEANITVTNTSGYLSRGETVNGIYWTPSNMAPGEYIIKVTPLIEEEGDMKTIPITIYQGMDDFKFVVYYGEEDISTKMDISKFPTTRTIVAYAAAAILMPLLFIAYRKYLTEEEDGTGKKGKKGGKGSSDPGIFSKLLAVIEEEPELKKNLGTGAAFALLGFLASSWCPFYPWWMILLFTLILGSVGYKFPFIGLIMVSFISIGAAGFQTPQFGLIFLVFSLIVCICSLFNWKFGYLTFMMVFLSSFGLSFLVPIAAIFMFSLFLSVTSTLVSGIFMTILVATGNLNNLSFLVTDFASQKESIITFSRSADYGIFTPRKFLDSISGIRNLDLSILGSFIKNYMDSMVPLIQLLFWIILIIGIYLFKKHISGKKEKINPWFLGIIAYFILLSVSIIGMLVSDFDSDVIFRTKNIVIYLLMFPAVMTAVLSGTVIRNAFAELYQDTKKTIIGTRIGESMNLRKTSFKKVGGLKDVKEEIRDSIVGPLLKPEMSKKFGVEPPKGLILFGPPGCGKTLLMRVIATELEVDMIGVKCSDIMSKWYGESENLIAALFESARERKPCVLFLDEIDAIAKRRDFYSADDVTPRLLSIMLSEMDGMDKFEEIIIIAATNRPELIDPALLRPGRFDKVVYIPPPKAKSRMDILKIHLKGKPVSRNIDLKKIAKLTKGYSGADVANLCKECAVVNLKRAIKTGRNTVINMKDFVKMSRTLKPSLSSDIIKEYEELQINFERKIKKTQTKKDKGKKQTITDEDGWIKEEEEEKETVDGREYDEDGEDESSEGWIEE